MNGESGSGYLSSNSLTDWPFSVGSVPTRVARLFSDALVFFPSMSECRGAFVSEVIRADNEFSFFVSILDERGNERRVGTIRTGVQDERYVVESVDLDGVRASFVLDGWHLKDSETFMEYGPFYICSSCLAPSCGKVLSLSIWNSVNGVDPPVVTNSGIRGDVKLIGGYNVVTEYSNSVEKGISINAEPGTGYGVVPCECDDPDEGEQECGGEKIRRKGNVESGENGDIIISSDHCVSTVPFRGIGTIMVYGRCNAPCTVDMYLDEANGLKELSRKIKTSRLSLFDSADRYNRNVVDLKNKRPCDDLIVSASVNQLPFGEHTLDLSESEIRGSLDRLSAKVNIANTGFKTWWVKVYNSAAWTFEDTDGDGESERVVLKLKRGVISVPEQVNEDKVYRKMLYADVDAEYTIGIWPPFALPPGTAADVTSLFFSPRFKQKRTNMSGHYQCAIGAYPTDSPTKPMSEWDASHGEVDPWRANPNTCFKYAEVDF